MNKKKYENDVNELVSFLSQGDSNSGYLIDLKKLQPDSELRVLKVLSSRTFHSRVKELGLLRVDSGANNFVLFVKEEVYRPTQGSILWSAVNARTFEEFRPYLYLIYTWKCVIQPLIVFFVLMYLFSLFMVVDKQLFILYSAVMLVTMYFRWILNDRKILSLTIPSEEEQYYLNAGDIVDGSALALRDMWYYEFVLENAVVFKGFSS